MIWRICLKYVLSIEKKFCKVEGWEFTKVSENPRTIYVNGERSFWDARPQASMQWIKQSGGQSLIKNSACTHTILIDLAILCIFIGSASNLKTKYYKYKIIMSWPRLLQEAKACKFHSLFNINKGLVLLN